MSEKVKRDDRNSRLAHALRDNLRKRKAQNRAQQQPRLPDGERAENVQKKTPIEPQSER
ncbi:hypothetical protein MCEMSEM23_00461 [Rhabdaerophilaceae bacterium]